VAIFDSGTNCTTFSATTFNSLIPFTGTISSTNSLICNSSNIGTASINLSGGSGAQSYLWSSPGGIQSTSTASLLSAGIHTVLVSDLNTFCEITQTFLITQPPPFTLNLIPSSTLACAGTSVSIAAGPSGGMPGYNISWINGSAGQINLVTENTAGSFTYSAAGFDANLCPASATITLLFVSYPVLTANNPVICLGVVATLTASGAQAYSWLPGSFTGSIVNVSPTANSSYTLLGNTQGCSSALPVFVTVNPLPQIVITTNSSVCEGSVISLNASGNGAYAWAGPNGFSAAIQNPSFLAPLNASGNYSLTVTDINNCSASTSTNIIVYAKPVISAIGASVCIGEPATLGAFGGGLYNWVGPNNFTSNQASAFIPTVGISSAGAYTLFVTNNNFCTSAAIVQVIGYNFPLPSPSISSSSRVCLNSKITLKGFGGGSYLWTGPANFTSSDRNIEFTASNLNTAGLYPLTVKNQSNCAASSTVLVTIYPLPHATVTSSRDKTCIPLCTDFSLKMSNNIAPIVKKVFMAGTSVLPDSVSAACLQVEGKIPVYAFFTDTNGCVNSSNLELTVLPKPTAGFESSPELPVENIDEVFFTNTSLGENLTSWNWFFIDNNGFRSELKNMAYVFDKPGIYPVSLIATNKWGCRDTIVKPVVIDEDFTLFVPSAFTPNQDGKNELFQPKGYGISTYHLQIFDRWGERIFSSKDFLKGWDGTFKGSACKIDTYIWKIDAVSLRGKIKNISGLVTLIE